MHSFSTGRVHVILRGVSLALIAVLAVPLAASAAPNALLLRLFLTGGKSVVSYGEYARVDGRVVFSTPLGGNLDAPRLQVVSLPGNAIDWERTERYNASARQQRYAATRGPADFEQLEREVASVLSEIAVTTRPARALELAEMAREALAAWPAGHYGYRADDIREILTIVDQAVGTLRATAGEPDFNVEFSTEFADVPLEPVLGMPTLPEQVDYAFTIAELTERPDDRVAVLEAALRVLDEIDGEMPAAEVAVARRAAREQIAFERRIDEQYTAMSNRMLDAAVAAAEAARVGAVEALLSRVSAEDARLGGNRPDSVRALQASLRGWLEQARRERLRLDQWEIRKGLHAGYQATAGSMLQTLTDMTGALTAIRRLDGPGPEVLLTLRRQLRGGAERLELMLPAGELWQTHQLVIAAWRFAENAVLTRYAAASSGDVDQAWEASSAAAGALSMLERAQQDLQALLDMPPPIMAPNVVVGTASNSSAAAVSPQ